MRVGPAPLRRQAPVLARPFLAAGFGLDEITPKSFDFDPEPAISAPSAANQLPM